MYSEREGLMRTLASRVEFSVEKARGGFTLLRTVDVVPPACEECLTLNQAEHTNLEIARSRLGPSIGSAMTKISQCHAGRIGKWTQRLREQF